MLSDELIGEALYPKGFSKRLRQTLCVQGIAQGAARPFAQGGTTRSSGGRTPHILRELLSFSGFQNWYYLLE